MKDLYKTLGVGEDAGDAEIKKAYRKLAKEFHPDVTGDDKKKTERFKEINEAYDVLGDAGKRKEYDRLKHAPMRPDGMPEGFDPDAFARAFGGQRATAGGFEFGGDADLGDMFSTLFGQGGRSANPWGRSARPRQNRGPDMVGQVSVSFAEAALGTHRNIRTGSGTPIDIAIPAGVESGGRLRVPRKGGAPTGPGGSAGDLYLDIDVRSDPFLRRDGLDITLELPVSIPEAVLGGKVEVPTVEGPVTVTIPPGTSSGAKLRLRGRGIKQRDGSRGDQICRVEIVAPKLDPEDKETQGLFEEIARRQGKTPVRKF
jgi:DnaJ-class molecular chaperone